MMRIFILALARESQLRIAAISLARTRGIQSASDELTPGMPPKNDNKRMFK